jgi:hypothetical protein
LGSAEFGYALLGFALLGFAQFFAELRFGLDLQGGKKREVVFRGPPFERSRPPFAGNADRSPANLSRSERQHEREVDLHHVRGNCSKDVNLAKGLRP